MQEEDYDDVCVVQIAPWQEVLELVGHIASNVGLRYELVDLNIPLHPTIPHLQRLQLAHLYQVEDIRTVGLTVASRKVAEVALRLATDVLNVYIGQLGLASFGEP